MFRETQTILTHPMTVPLLLAALLVIAVFWTLMAVGSGRDVDYTNVTISQAQADNMFGDKTVELPSKVTPPAHWPKEKLEWHEFATQWRAWQKSIGFDPDTPGD
jgi:hypothetical protein